MNKKDYSLEELSKLYVQIGRKKHGIDGAYPWALGSIIGMVDFNVKYNPSNLQNIINQRYSEAEKELASL